MNIEIGQRFKTDTKTVTFSDMKEFEKVVWDRGQNVHNDEDQARASGLSQPIASGQQQMAFLHELLEDAFGDAWRYGGSIKTRWIRPVRDGDRITPHAEVASVGGAGERWQRVSLEVWCSNQGGERTAVGTAQVHVPRIERTSNTRRALNGQNNPPSKGALADLRVLELTHAWAGPYCGMMLGDLGAEVIKVEAPLQDPESRGGFPYVGGESVPFMMLHRNKKSLTVDLKTDEGKQIFYDLAASSDVVIQNFRPGVVQKLGVSYEELREVNPALIYASISGFGTWGPYADHAGVNMIAQAASGLTATTMGDGRPPIPLGTALCDIVAAMWAGYGVVAALRERELTGRGQHIDSSLVEAGLSLMMGPMATDVFASESARSYGRTDGNAPSGFFEAADGVYVAVFASYPALWTKFIKAVDMEHLNDEDRFAARDARSTHADALHDVLRQVFKTRPSGEWVDLLERAGVPVAPVEGVGRVLNKPYVQDRGSVVNVDHPTAGVVPLLRLPVRLSETPAKVVRAAPLLGEHTDAVLRSIGLGDKLESLRSAGIIGAQVSHQT